MPEKIELPVWCVLLKKLLIEINEEAEREEKRRMRKHVQKRGAIAGCRSGKANITYTSTKR